MVMKSPTKMELLLLELGSQQAAEEIERKRIAEEKARAANKEKADLILRTIKMQLARSS